ncbi:hypothetical protein SNEBB_004672 [Seison nebaliae]|nr:hypothetical protein SNEBB_004672 [Seison nebaliae]
MLAQLNWKKKIDEDDNTVVLRLSHRKGIFLYYDHPSSIVKISKFDKDFLLLTSTSEQSGKWNLENYYIFQIENSSSRIIAVFKFPTNCVVNDSKKILVKSKNGLSFEKTGNVHFPTASYKLNHSSLDQWICTTKYAILVCDGEGRPISMVIAKWQQSKNITLHRSFYVRTHSDNFETLRVRWKNFQNYIHNRIIRQYLDHSHTIADNLFLPESREYDPKKIVKENPLLLCGKNYELYVIAVSKDQTEHKIKSFQEMTKKQQKIYWKEVYYPYNSDKKILETPIGASDSLASGLVTLEENERQSIQSIAKFEKYDISDINSRFGRVKRDTKVGFVMTYDN